MQFIYQLLPENILFALGWTVLHSLWQAFIVALLLAAYQLGWKKTNARQRYLAGFVALGTLLVVTGCTFFIMLDASAGPGLLSEMIAVDETQMGRYFLEEKQSAYLTYFNRNMPLIVLAWFAGMVFFLLKMVGGLLYIQRLKSHRLAAVPDEWNRILSRLKKETGLSKYIGLSTSVLVKVPMVAGWLKPVILMPVAALNQLTTEQVEAILAHELAHIARYDYLLNLLQSLIEIIFYFNPAVWWISSNIRSEREHCCDDIAVRLCGNSLTYARALVSLQEMHYVTPAFAMSFSKNRNQLLNRIQRILQQSQKKSNAMEKLSATVLLLAAVLILSLQAKTPLNDLFAENEVSENCGETVAPDYNALLLTDLQLPGDTIPENKTKGYVHWKKQDDGEEIEVKMKDGKIKFLEIDGQEIPESEYGEYEYLIEEMLTELPPPPPPAAPPPPAPPAPPAAPHFREAPPSPPAPAPNHRKIITEKSNGGTTVIIQSTDGEDPVKIEFKKGRKGSVIINGNEVKGLKDGDRTVIIEDSGKKSTVPFLFNNDYGYHFVVPEIPEFPEITLPEIAFEEVPGFSYSYAFPPGSAIVVPDETHWNMHENDGRLRFTPRNDWQGEREALLQEYQDRMRDGNMSDEWLQEFHEKMRATDEEAELFDGLEGEKMRMEELKGFMESQKFKKFNEGASIFHQQEALKDHQRLLEEMNKRNQAEHLLQMEEQLKLNREQLMQMEELQLHREQLLQKEELNRGQLLREQEILQRNLEKEARLLEQRHRKVHTPDDGRM